MSKEQQFESRLVELFRTAFGAELSSVVVYGSYATGQWSARVSDINVLVLVKQCSAAALQSLGRAGHRLLHRHRVTPLILSEREFANSADVFPMEYMDIIARHRVLFGADPTEHVQFSRVNLRHELEHQLRGTMLSLRQVVIAARGRRRPLLAELKQLAGSVAALFRGLLRLHGTEDVPVGPEALIAAVNEAYGLTPGPFLTLLSLRGGGAVEPVALAADLLARLEELVRIVDAYDTGS